MSKQPVLFQENSRYILVTPENPKGFKGSLFIAWEGETPDNLTEVVKTTDQLQALVQANCRIELTSISTEWQTAFAKVADLSLPIEPVIAKSTATKPTAEPVAVPIGSNKPTAKTDLFVQMAPLCVTWVWAFGVATLVAMLFGIIN